MGAKRKDQGLSVFLDFHDSLLRFLQPGFPFHLGTHTKCESEMGNPNLPTTKDDVKTRLGLFVHWLCLLMMVHQATKQSFLYGTVRGHQSITERMHCLAVVE